MEKQNKITKLDREKEVREIDFENNYNRAGEVTQDVNSELIMEETIDNLLYDHAYIVGIIDSVCEEIHLPYSLEDFQIESLVSLGQGPWLMEKMFS